MVYLVAIQVWASILPCTMINIYIFFFRYMMINYTKDVKRDAFNKQNILVNFHIIPIYIYFLCSFRRMCCVFYLDAFKYISFCTSLFWSFGCLVLTVLENMITFIWLCYCWILLLDLLFYVWSHWLICSSIKKPAKIIFSLSILTWLINTLLNPCERSFHIILYACIKRSVFSMWYTRTQQPKKFLLYDLMCTRSHIRRVQFM